MNAVFATGTSTRSLPVRVMAERWAVRQVLAWREPASGGVSPFRRIAFTATGTDARAAPTAEPGAFAAELLWLRRAVLASGIPLLSAEEIVREIRREREAE